MVAALAVLFTLSLGSCTKTVTETVYVPVHDTTRGPALLRFISMLPNDQAVHIKTVNDPAAPSAFDARSTSSPFYLPLVPDSAVVYYLFTDFTSSYASVPIPNLPANSINTCCLFKDSSQAMFWIANDSMKLHAAPAGQCYIRFVNGVANYPASGPTLFLDLDTFGHSAFSDTTGNHGVPVAQPVQYGMMNNYSLIPAGSHLVFVRADQTQLLTTPIEGFQAGAYYTARVYGSYPNVGVAIDQD